MTQYNNKTIAVCIFKMFPFPCNVDKHIMNDLPNMQHIAKRKNCVLETYSICVQVIICRSIFIFFITGFFGSPCEDI